MKHLKKTMSNAGNESTIVNQWIDEESRVWTTTSLKRGPVIVDGVEVKRGDEVVHVHDGKHHEQALQEAVSNPDPRTLKERRKAEDPTPAPTVTKAPKPSKPKATPDPEPFDPASRSTSGTASTLV